MSDDSWSVDPVITSTASTSIVVADTNAIGPSAHCPTAPAGRPSAMTATNSPTAATTEIMSTGKRHQGIRLARKVETGTQAAATEITRTRESGRDPGALGPQPALVDEQHEQVDRELAVGEHREERLDEVVHVVAGLVVVGEVGQPGLGPALGVVRRGVAGQRRARHGSRHRQADDRQHRRRDVRRLGQALLLGGGRHQQAGAEVRAARDDEPQPLAAAGIRERCHDEVGADRARRR